MALFDERPCYNNLCSCQRNDAHRNMVNISRVSHIFQLNLEPLGEWNNTKTWENIYRFCTRERTITTLSLNACLNQMQQELSH